MIYFLWKYDILPMQYDICFAYGGIASRSIKIIPEFRWNSGIQSYFRRKYIIGAADITGRKAYIIDWQSQSISFHYLPSSLVLWKAASTAFMAAARKAPCSRARTPAMVEPPGEQTASFRAPGC